MATNIDRDLKVKVLVLGDSGVGKSSLTYRIANGYSAATASSFDPGYTIGCSTDIKLHDFKQGTLDEKTFCVEIWDIGASKYHASSRSIFYNGVNGVILVHDLTNNKSLMNLQKWHDEVVNKDCALSSVKVTSIKSPSSGSNTQQAAAAAGASQLTSPLSMSSSNGGGATSLPVIMIGTKLDQRNESERAYKKTYAQNKLATLLNCTQIHLDTGNSKYLAAGSGNSVELSRFFDKAIEHSMNSQRSGSSAAILMSQVNSGSSSADSRRFGSTMIGSADQRKRNNFSKMSTNFKSLSHQD